MIQTIINKAVIFFLIIAAPFSVIALEFNQSKIINKASKGNELKADEGYLVLSLETKYPLQKIIIKPEGSGKSLVFKEIPNGNNFALIKVKAGNYYLHGIKIDSDYSHKKFKNNRFLINVKAGIINYPGSFEFIVNDYINESIYYNIYLTNKALVEYLKFRQNYPVIDNKLQFEYQAQFKDPFIDFYEKLFPTSKKSVIVDSLNQLANNNILLKNQVFDPNNGVHSEVKKHQQITNYLKADTHSIESMNPNSTLVVATMEEGDIYVIAILNLKTFKSYTLLTKELPEDSFISSIKWIDNDSIFYRFGNNGVYTNHIAHLNIDANGEINKVEMLNLPTNGFLISPMIDFENEILFYKPSRYHKKFGVFKVDVSTKNSIFFSLKKRYSRKEIFNEAHYWLSDSNGNLKFTVTSEYDKKTDVRTLFYWFRENIENDNWKMIKSFTTDDDYFYPSYISPDNKSFYVVSDEETDKNSVLSYSTQDFSFEKIIFEDPLINVESILVDSTTQQFNGIRYIDKGVIKSKYFDSESDHLKEAKEANPELNLYSVQNNTINGNLLLFGTRLDSEGAWYTYNIEDKTFIKLLQANPDYEKLEKGSISVVSIKSSDDLDIEGFLVEPKNKTSATPLIVIPHGGPIGVRDYAHNDSVQHFLASKGFASLKVNYRGSEGYGKAFKKLGNQQWGEKIEEDIDAMVSHVIKNFNISESQICAMGGSYGGYSAIMLSILYPERYKCAVSLAGVTDLPLKFSSHNWFKAEKTLNKLKEIIGDPDVNMIQLIDKSPVYQFEKVTKPILLFQGLEDTNVTPEHALRFYQVTKKANKEVSLIMLKDEGHSFKNIESQIYYLSKSIEFINKNLKLETQ
jgi:dipeptidyl aminopeptidase/acylaminoacyl peptidase